MIGKQITDRRTRRHEATRQEIVDAAWDVARENGVAALTLGEVAARVGMRVPSLYSYFSSKHDIYDAMFSQGSEEFLQFIRLQLAALPHSLRERARGALRIYFDFCTQDPIRYQLLFQRPIPGFVPSKAAYGKAAEAVQIFRDDLAAHGLQGDSADQDLIKALGAGLADQQIANDPGGDRWARLVDEVADMAFDHLMKKHASRAPSRNRAHARVRR